MPKTVSLAKIPEKVKTIKNWLGASVPWEVRGYAEDVSAFNTTGGIFDLSSYATLTFEGKDAFDFLNRMSTLNFKTFNDHTAGYGAFLTGRGTVVSLGIFLREKDRVSYLITESLRQITLEHVEKFHFAEQFNLVDESEAFALFGWWNPKQQFLDELNLSSSIPVGIVEWRRWKSQDLLVWRDPAREKLFWFKTERRNAELFLTEMERLKIPVLGHSVFENLRIRSGIPEMGVELSDKEIILETGFDLAVHRAKGCYPGQEVVERIFTYGSVNKKLFCVQVETANPEKVALPIDLREGDRKVGTLMSFTPDTLNKNHGWGLAYLQKEYWNIEKTFKLP